MLLLAICNNYSYICVMQLPYSLSYFICLCKTSFITCECLHIHAYVQTYLGLQYLDHDDEQTKEGTKRVREHSRVGVASESLERGQL